MSIISKATAASFWARIKITAAGECWNWKGATVAFGYGILSVGGHRWYAHRLAYHLTNGHIPAGRFVCHKCDNPACCNPAHLWLGTIQDNNADCLKKGRHFCQRKKPSHLNPNAKLSQKDVNDMRALFDRQKITYRALGEIFGVTHTAAFKIIKGQLWQTA